MTKLCLFQEYKCPMEGSNCIREPLCKRITSLEECIKMLMGTEDFSEFARITFQSELDKG